MPIYTIQSPDGQTVKLEGPTAPSEMELDEIFAQLSLEKDPVYNGLNESQRKNVESLKTFDESVLGSSLNKVQSFIDAIVPGDQSPLTAEKLATDYKSGATKLTKSNIKDAVKTSVLDGIDFATMALPVTKGGLISKAVKSSGIIGSGEFAKGLIKGKKLDSNIKESLTSAAVTGGIQLTAPLVGKALKLFGDGLLKSSTNVRNFAIDVAKKNPDILTKPQPLVTEVADSFKSNLDDFARFTKASYQKKLDSLGVRNRSIPLNETRKALQKLDLNPEVISSKLRTSAKSELVNVSDEAIENFVSGKKVGYQDARKLNSLLFDITNTGVGSEIGSGGIGKLGSLKSALLKDISAKVPKTRQINKEYAKRTKFYSDLNKKFKNPQEKEALLNSIGQQLSGLKRNKTGMINQLKRLDRFMPREKRLVPQLIKSVAAEEFERTGMTNLTDLIRITAGAGIGANFGVMGAAAGAATAAISSSKAALAPTIKATQGLKRVAESEASKSLLNLTSRRLGQKINRE